MSRLAALALASLVSASALASAQTAPPRLRANVSGLRSNNGQVLCLAFRSADGFPGDRTKAAARTFAVIRNNRATCSFSGLPAGEYAVTVLHDEDGDNALDTGLFGIPTEGIGMSNDARASFGPPPFSAAKFQYDGADMQIRITASYF